MKLSAGQVWEVGSAGPGYTALFLVTRYCEESHVWMAIGLDLPLGWSSYKEGVELVFLLDEPHSNMRLVA